MNIEDKIKQIINKKVIKEYLRPHNRYVLDEIKKYQNINILDDILNNDDLFDSYIKEMNGVNLIGYINSPIGLGHNGRMIIESLNNMRIPYVINDIKTVTSNINNVKYKTSNISPFSTNIFCVNPEINIDKYLKDKRNIALWAWELEELPINWINESCKFDEIWTISNFCEDILKRNIDKDIKKINFPVDYKKIDKDFSKEYFNIDVNKFVFLFSFDYNSRLERKNINSLIDSFNKSFQNNDDVLLFIKTHNLPVGKIKETSNIKVLNKILNEEDRNILMNCSDVYISLHRSEGYGLTILESIMLEKPIICSDYSGNLDFCDPNYMELVKGSYVDVHDSYYNNKSYNNDIKWFDVDIEDASNKMISVYNNIEKYEKLIIEWKVIIKDKINKEVLNTFIKKNLNYIEVPPLNINEKNNFNYFMDICYDMTKYLPKKYPIINRNSKKKSVYIENRNLKHNEFLIKNTIQKLGDDWGHIIYCSDINKEQIKKICSEISSEIEIRHIDSNINRNDYNNLLLDIEFWNDIDCENVLIYQSDTIIINDFDDKFLKFDYIGANWGPSNHSKNLNKIFKKFGIEINLLQGNGGLSLRNVELMKSALLDSDYKRILYINVDIKLNKIPEDCFFAAYTKLNGNLPDNTENFSIEPSGGLKESLLFSDNPFGFHKIYNFDNFDKYLFDKFYNRRLDDLKCRLKNFSKNDFKIYKNHNLKKSKLTVIISLYNYEDYIERAIDSVISNKISNIEIMIINDFSEDGSLEKCLPYLETNNNITIIDKKINIGIIHTRNLGIQEAIGEYVFILDADNYLYDNCLSEHLSMMDGSDLISCYGIIDSYLEDEFIAKISNSEFSIDKLKEGNYIDAMAIFNREKLIDIGSYNYELMDYGIGWEDYELWLRISESDYKVGFINKSLSRYTIKDSSLNNLNSIYHENIKKYLNRKYNCNLIYKE